jgi:hypothetical protein
MLDRKQFYFSLALLSTAPMLIFIPLIYVFKGTDALAALAMAFAIGASAGLGYGFAHWLHARVKKEEVET